jgi:hypothetical protein
MQFDAVNFNQKLREVADRVPVIRKPNLYDPFLWGLSAGSQI